MPDLKIVGGPVADGGRTSSWGGYLKAGGGPVKHLVQDRSVPAR